MKTIIITTIRITTMFRIAIRMAVTIAVRITTIIVRKK